MAMEAKSQGRDILTYDITKQVKCSRNYALVVRARMIKDRMIAELDWPTRLCDSETRSKNYRNRMEKWSFDAIEILRSHQGQSVSVINPIIAERLKVSLQTVIKIRAKLLREKRIQVEDWPASKFKEHSNDAFHANECRIRIMCWAAQLNWGPWRKAGFETEKEYEKSPTSFDRVSRVRMDGRSSNMKRE